MIRTKAQCIECSRVFDLLDEDDSNEWAYGHDCEAQTMAEMILIGFGSKDKTIDLTNKTPEQVIEEMTN